MVSPPMDHTPEITPLSAAIKYITIKIYDTFSQIQLMLLILAKVLLTITR